MEMGEDIGEAHKNVTSSRDGDGGNVEYDAAADTFVTEFTVADDDDEHEGDDVPGTARPAVGGADQWGGGEKRQHTAKKPVRESNPPPHLPKHPTRRLPAPGWDPQHWKRQKWCIVGRGGKGRESPKGLGGAGPTARTNRTVGSAGPSGARNRARSSARKLRLDTPRVGKHARILQARAVATLNTCDPYSAPGPYAKVREPLEPGLLKLVHPDVGNCVPAEGCLNMYQVS